MNSLTRGLGVAVLPVLVAGCTASAPVEERAGPASAPTVVPTEPDGSIRMKWPWWRAVPEALLIEGRRLDTPAPPPSAHVYEEGYRGRAFLPSSIYFPTEGCWEVTGRVGDGSLTFVTLVLRIVE